ncbi:hypothetical protein [Ralstonia solanacearum]|uniref:hypothetical protein n=1 Tax=Ralstonia solanacearum TaxID=305 RepID=UPI0018D09253|nr:hypothetical protein [Ralstonia solanacearum]
MKRTRAMLAMAALVWGVSGQGAEPVGAMPAGAAPLFGVTVDAVDDVNGVVDALAHLSHTPTARIVFDEGMDAAHYAAPVAAIRRVAYVMGELIDSSTLRMYSVRQVGERATDYLDVLAGSVDLWEIGNEINGEWTGRTRDVVDKTLAAYDAVKQRGARTALTLYYNEGCAEQPSRAMFDWAGRNLPARLRNGVDYVFISYYEDDCPIAPPDWNAVFARLGELFPHAALGFGEVGTRHAERKPALIAHYYGLTIEHPRYVGGYFWWSFRQDMVPRSRPLWRHIDAAFQLMQARTPAPLTR